MGAFHFHYPGLDAHVTANSDKVDVLSESRKPEVTELVNYIKKFKPTKIAIEAFPQWKATEKLRQYKEGAHRDKRDERYQLGLRIASELNLDTIYAIDDDSMVSQLMTLDSTYFKKLFKDYDYQSDDPFSKMYKAWYVSDDKLRSKLDLLSYFKHINARRYHAASHGAYLVGDFKLEDKEVLMRFLSIGIVEICGFSGIFRKLLKVQRIGFWYCSETVMVPFFGSC